MEAPSTQAPLAHDELVLAVFVGAHDDGLQRAVKENCNVLKFKNAEFESGE